MTSLRALFGVAACGAVVLLSACDDGRAVAPVYPTRADEPSASSGSSGDEDIPSPSSSSSSGGTNAAPTLMPGKCATVTIDSACTMPSDVEDVYYEDAWVTTDASCKTYVYATSFDSWLRRYELTSVSPCTFERDLSFGEITDVVGQVAADDAGNTYVTRYDGTVRRVSPGAPVTCTATSFAPTAPALHQQIAISRDGKLGFVAFGDVDGANPVLGKITTTASGCEVTGLTLDGGGLVNAYNLAIDAKGRLHIADATFTGGEGRVKIYDANGVFVSSYDQSTNGKFFRVSSITPCLGGMCVEDLDEIVRLTDDGAPGAKEKFAPQPIQTFRRILGNADSGRLFSIGGRFTKVEDPPAISVWMLKNR